MSDIDQLDQLAAEAAAVDAENAPAQLPIEQPAEEQQAAAHDEVAELSAIIGIVTSLFAPVFPSLTKIYTPETVASIAGAAVPVMQKHGLSTGGILGKWAEELALLAVVAPVAMATYQGVQSDIAAAKAKPEEVPKVLESVAVEPVAPAADQPQVMARG